MRKLMIQNKDGSLKGEICPDYGGMLVRLIYQGKEIISVDEGNLHTANVLSGGCPILFPFPSRTKGDVYQLNGKEFAMPFHGLVKNSAFAVKEHTMNSATLYITNNEASMQDHFPFDYRLEVTYRMEESGIIFETVIYNRSMEPMPHYFGWHHYFNVSDKQKARIIHPMKWFLDYTDGCDGELHQVDTGLDLAQRMDWVLFDKSANEIELENEADGYRMFMKMDESFQAMVVCTYFDGKVTLEPWLGIPDSIHKGKYVEWLEPGENKSYSIEIKLEKF